MQSANLCICNFKLNIFLEKIPQFTVIIGLFICKFVTCQPYFLVPTAYNEVLPFAMLLFTFIKYWNVTPANSEGNLYYFVYISVYLSLLFYMLPFFTFKLNIASKQPSIECNFINIPSNFITKTMRQIIPQTSTILSKHRWRKLPLHNLVTPRFITCFILFRD